MPEIIKEYTIKFTEKEVMDALIIYANNDLKGLFLHSSKNVKLFCYPGSPLRRGTCIELLLKEPVNWDAIRKKM